MSESRQSTPPLQTQPTPMTPPTAPAASQPECIGICNPEPLSGKCEGCGRQLQPPAE